MDILLIILKRKLMVVIALRIFDNFVSFSKKIFLSTLKKKNICTINVVFLVVFYLLYLFLYCILF